MSIIDSNEFMKKVDKKTKMEMKLAMYGAPFLKGMKMANIMTVDKEEFADISFVLAGTNIAYRFLKGRGKNTILYLYRENELKAYLESEEVQVFLRAFGYMSYDLESVLARLSNRIYLYHDGGMEFPHEIGVFLGYPLSDVKGFVRNNGKNYLLSGYWKVYKDVEKAAKLFERFDRERECAVQDVLAGKGIVEIAV